MTFKSRYLGTVVKNSQMFYMNIMVLHFCKFGQIYMHQGFKYLKFSDDNSFCELLLGVLICYLSSIFSSSSKITNTSFWI